MAAITASMVSELRGKTDAPMMECKKALTEADGDMAKAEEILRVKLGNKATKAARALPRKASSVSVLSADGKLGAIVEVNSETDFVAKNDEFIALARVAPKLVATRTRPTWRRCRPCRWARARWNRRAPRWSARSARTWRSAVSPASRPGQAASPTSTADPRSACWSTSSVATRRWPRIWRCTSPHPSRSRSMFGGSSRTDRWRERRVRPPIEKAREAGKPKP
jgi:hypothetical protein